MHSRRATTGSAWPPARGGADWTMRSRTRSADETASKPNPLMLLELMREFGTEPERTLMIGDTTHDLLLARNAGTPSAAVAFGAHGHESFAEFGPLYVAHSTRELHDWLLSNA